MKLMLIAVGLSLFFVASSPPEAGAEACKTSDIKIKGFTVEVVDTCRLTPTPCPYVKFVGEVVNRCRYSTGVLLQMVARDGSGQVVDVLLEYPALMNNIPAHSTYPFALSYGMDYKKSMKDYSVKVISVIHW